MPALDEMITVSTAAAPGVREGISLDAMVEESASRGKKAALDVMVRLSTTPAELQETGPVFQDYHGRLKKVAETQTAEDLKTYQASTPDLDEEGLAKASSNIQQANQERVWRRTWELGWPTMSVPEKVSVARKALRFEMGDGLVALPGEREPRAASEPELQMLQELAKEHPGTLTAAEQFRIARMARRAGPAWKEFASWVEYGLTGIPNLFGLMDRFVPGVKEFATHLEETSPVPEAAPIVQAVRELGSWPLELATIGVLARGMTRVSTLAAGLAKHIPVLRRAGPPLQRAVEFAWLQKNAPTMARYLSRATKQALRFAPVGTIVGGMRAVAQDMTLGDALKEMGIDTAIFAGIGAVHGALAEADVQIQVSRLEKALRKQVRIAVDDSSRFESVAGWKDPLFRAPSAKAPWYVEVVAKMRAAGASPRAIKRVLQQRIKAEPYKTTPKPLGRTRPVTDVQAMEAATNIYAMETGQWEHLSVGARYRLGHDDPAQVLNRIREISALLTQEQAGRLLPGRLAESPEQMALRMFREPLIVATAQAEPSAVQRYQTAAAMARTAPSAHQVALAAKARPRAAAPGKAAVPATPKGAVALASLQKATAAVEELTETQAGRTAVETFAAAGQSSRKAVQNVPGLPAAMNRAGLQARTEADRKAVLDSARRVLGLQPIGGEAGVPPIGGEEEAGGVPAETAGEPGEAAAPTTKFEPTFTPFPDYVAAEKPRETYKGNMLAEDDEWVSDGRVMLRKSAFKTDKQRENALKPQKNVTRIASVEEAKAARATFAKGVGVLLVQMGVLKADRTTDPYAEDFVIFAEDIIGTDKPASRPPLVAVDPATLRAVTKRVSVNAWRLLVLPSKNKGVAGYLNDEMVAVVMGMGGDAVDRVLTMDVTNLAAGPAKPAAAVPAKPSAAAPKKAAEPAGVAKTKPPAPPAPVKPAPGEPEEQAARPAAERKPPAQAPGAPKTAKVAPEGTLEALPGLEGAVREEATVQIRRALQGSSLWDSSEEIADFPFSAVTIRYWMSVRNEYFEKKEQLAELPAGEWERESQLGGDLEIIEQKLIDLAVKDFEAALDTMEEEAESEKEGGKPGAEPVQLGEEKKHGKPGKRPPAVLRQGEADVGEKPSEPRPGAEEGRPAGEGPETRVRVGVEHGGTPAGQGGTGVHGEKRGDKDVHRPPRHPKGKSTPGARATSGRDYHLTDSSFLRETGIATRFDRNIAAIRIVKQLQAEGRRATAEEQEVLIQFTGWGQMKQAFESWGPNRKYYNTLKELLTEEEYDSALRSVVNAHYTDPAYIAAIWDALQAYGFKGGRICDPSIGTGLFFALMPEAIYRNSTLTGGDLDTLSAAISQQLQQNTKVSAKGFEDIRYPDNFFDLFISNVPFGNFHAYDETMKRESRFQIHDFFFAKALAKTKPGGLVVFITSKGTMDSSRSTAAREYFKGLADLVGAIRLPKTAFVAAANTEVVADILIFQKRPPGAAVAGEDFQEQSRIEIARDPKSGRVPAGEKVGVSINAYFARHPTHVLGTHSLSGSMYKADTYSVDPLEGKGTGDALAEEIKKILATDAFDLLHNLPAVEEVRKAKAGAGPTMKAPVAVRLKQGSYAVRGKKIFKREGEEMVPVEGVAAATAARMASLIAIRDAARALIRAQVTQTSTVEEDVEELMSVTFEGPSEPEPEEDVETLRKNLNALYNAHVKQYGPLNKQENARALADDPDWPLLQSLEEYDRKTKVATKAEIFRTRTQTAEQIISHVDTADEALVASLDQRGKVDLAYMKGISGFEEKELLEGLGEKVFRVPGGEWVAAEQYLSGNVRTKLNEAKAAADADPAFERNVLALEAVQPKDLAPSKISVKLGSTWIPPGNYSLFLSDVFERHNIRVKYSEHTATYFVSNTKTDRYNTQETTDFGTEDFGALKLFEMSLNHHSPVVRFVEVGPDGKKTTRVDREATVAAELAQQRLKKRFTEWVWEDNERALELARIYNDQLNNIVRPVFHGDHLTLPGASSSVLKKLYPHQKDVAWRIIVNGNTLIAHVVGAGKTWAMAAAVMEMRRLGIAKKPMLVVPNSMAESGQWVQEFLEMYPGANLLAATSADFQKEKRQALMNRIATGDWDCVIVPMSSFAKIPMTAERIEEFFQKQVAELEAEMEQARMEGTRENKRFIKDLEKAKLRLVAQMKEMLDSNAKDPGPYFDELGVDALFVDEAHYYKNLYFHTKMTRIPGVQVNMTRKSFDMYLKTQYLNEVTNYRGVVFATGTPIANSIGEMFTMQRYLQPPLLQEQGVQVFDSWAHTYGELVTRAETSPEGGDRMRIHTRFASFSNIPELLSAFWQMADVKMRDDLAHILDRPPIRGGKAQTVECERSEDVAAYVAKLAERADAIRSRKVTPEEDNMLRVTFHGMSAALDMRLINPKYPDYPGSKPNRCVENLYRTWTATAAERSAQVVWCDLSVPKYGHGFSVYDDMKAKLIALGIPAREIAFIHDAGTDKKKLEAILQGVREGDIRILFASTQKLGVGTNMQTRLVEEHQLDAPWKPAEIEQRTGRMDRPGNKSKEIGINYYVMKKTFDAYRWQTLTTKARFIAQILSGRADVREMEDVSAPIVFDYGVIMAVAADNPKLMEMVSVENDVNILNYARKHFHDQQFEQRKELQRLKDSEVPHLVRRAAVLRKDAAGFEAAQAKAGEGKVDFTIAGAHYDDRTPAGEAFMKALSAAQESPKALKKGMDIGKAYGFALRLVFTTHPGKTSPAWEASLAGEGHYAVALGEDAVGNITRVVNTLKAIGEEAEHLEDERIPAMKKHLENLKEVVTRTFDKAGELEKKTARLAAIQDELGIKKDEKRAPSEEVGLDDSVEEEGEEGEAGLPEEAEEEGGYLDPAEARARELEDIPAADEVPTEQEMDDAEKAPADPLTKPTPIEEPKPIVSPRWPAGLPMVGKDFWTALMAVAKDLGIEYRYKHLRGKIRGAKSRGAWGPTRGVRLEDVADPIVGVHELSHEIDYRLGGRRGIRTIRRRFPGTDPDDYTEKELRAELYEVGRFLRPALWNPAAPKAVRDYAKNHREVMADFYTLFILAPETAEDIAPSVTALVNEQLLETANDALGKAIDRLRAARFTGPEETPLAEHIRETFPVRSLYDAAHLQSDIASTDYVELAEDLGITAARQYQVFMGKARQDAKRIRILCGEDNEVLEDLRVLAEEGERNLRTGKPRDQIEAELIPDRRNALDLYRAYQEQARQTVNVYLRDAGINEYIKFLEDYFIHAYQTPMTQKYRRAVARWAKHSPQAKRRVLPTLEDAMEIGLLPRTHNLAAGLELWAAINYRVATNLAFLRALPGITNEDGESIVQNPRNAPDWPTFDYQPIRRVYAHPLGAGKGVLLFEGRVAVDPKAAPFIQAMFDRPFTGGLARCVAGLNALWKGFELTVFSFFHHQVEYISLWGAIGPRAAPFVGGFWGRGAERFGKKKPFGFLPAHIGVLEAGRMLEDTPEFMDLYLRSGGQTGYITTEGRNIIQRWLNRATQRFDDLTLQPGLKGKAGWTLYIPANTLRAAYTWTQHLLWDNVQRAKLVTFYTIVQNGLKSRMAERGEITPSEIMETTARYLSDNFGGQEWLGHKGFRNPRVRWVLTQMMMSLDWTWSQIRTAGWPLAYGGFGKGLGGRAGRTKAQRALMRKIGRHHWLWYGFAVMAFTQIANMMLNKGKPTWMNEYGHRWDIDYTDLWRLMPWHDPDDPNRHYFSLGKDSRELIRWVAGGPWGMLRAFGMKLSPVARFMFEQLTGYNVGSTFPEPWAREDLEFYDQTTERFKHAMEMFRPFSFSESNAFFAFPASKGMTYWKAMKAYEDIYEAQAASAAGGIRGMMSKATRLLSADEDRLMVEISMACNLNQVDSEKSRKAALSNIRRRYYRKFWTAARDKDVDACNRWAKSLEALGVTEKGYKQSRTYWEDRLTEETKGISEEARKGAGID